MNAKENLVRVIRHDHPQWMPLCFSQKDFYYWLHLNPVTIRGG